MALQKQIELNNGVITNYHRIVSLNKITNVGNIIEIASYVSKKKRDEEALYQEVQKKNRNKEELTETEREILNKGINVLIETKYINKDYDENETIKDAYAYLKTTDKYKDAEDI